MAPVLGHAGPGTASPGRAHQRALCVLEGHDFTQWSRSHAAGEAAGRLPFGAEALRCFGFELRHSDAVWHCGRRWQQACERSRPLGYQFRLDGAVAQVVSALPLIARSAACVSVFEDQGLAYGAIRRSARRRFPPLVMMTCWLSQRLLELGPMHRGLYRRLCREASAITAFSANQVPLLAELLDLAEDRIATIPFGVDTEFYCPERGGSPDGGTIAVVGKDAGRDWATLARAAELTPDLTYVLATHPDSIAGQRFPRNVVGRQPLGHLAYRQLLRSASLSVVPTLRLAYPTGQSVLLESLSCGAPVVAAATPALADYSVPSCVLGYEVGEPESLASAVVELASDDKRRRAMAAAGRRVAVERFDSRVMWQHVAGVVDGVLAGGGWS